MEKMTTSEKHLKHPKLTRPNKGFYHRNEWAIYGSTCDKIESLYKVIESELADEIILGYIDADHDQNTPLDKSNVGKKFFHFSHSKSWNEYDDKTSMDECDAVIVNGNHYPASNQIIILDPNKKDSLLRRLEHLTNIACIITTESDQEVYDFLLPLINEKTLVIKDDKIDLLTIAITEKLSTTKPALKALILAGGKSTRMGKDKSQIKYYNKSQEDHLSDICKDLGLNTYISKAYGYPGDSSAIIKDKMIDMGPFGAIISAMIEDPDAAWLAIACDLPHLNSSILQRLVNERNSSKVATAFQSANKKFPEPLITIYEPRAFPRFLKFLSLGYACPRKVLINSDIKTITLEEEQYIENVNTPEDYQSAISKIHESK